MASTTASSAAAPASAPQPTPTPAAGQTRQGAAISVDLWYGWAGATAIATWQALGKQMGDALPGFNVRWITADNNVKLLTAIAGGSPPDAAVGNSPYNEFWARGAATQIDDMIGKSKVINRTDIPDAYWPSAMYKGKTYGVPAVESFVAYALCLDMTNLQKQNIDPKTLSWDWDTLTQLQQQLTQKASNGSVSVLGIDPLDAVSGGYTYWSQAWGFQAYDDQARKHNFANDQFVEALNIIKKLEDIAGGAQAIAGFHTSYGTWTESPTAMMPSGVEDMNVNGYWAPGELAHSAPNRQFAYTWAPVPASKKGFKFQEAAGHKAFLPRGVKHPAEGFQVIEYLVNDAAEQTILDNTGWILARRPFIAKLDVNKYPGLDFYVNSFTTQDKLYSSPPDPIDGFVSTQWSKAVQDVIYGKAQPMAALQQLQQQVTDELKQRFPNG